MENEGPEVKRPNSNSAWKWGRKNKIWGQPLIESVPDIKSVNSVLPPFTDDEKTLRAIFPESRRPECEPGAV